MSWYVLVDGNNVLARSGIADPSVLIGSPEVKTELNKAGSFQFEIYPPHPYYDRLIKMKTKIDVVLNGELIFSGRVLYTQTEMDKKRKVYCEGCLSYLLDSIQESYEYDSRITQFYDMTVHEFLDRLLVRHDKMFITDRLGVLDNFQGALTQIGISEGNTDTTDRLRRALKVYNNETSTSRDTFWIDDDTKLFKLGTVNAEGTADRFKFEIKGHSKTLDMILETLVDSVGGFMQAYRDPEDGWYVLDWKDKFGNENMQPIEWGTNLIELQQDESGVETFTRLYPVGKSSTNSNSTGADKNITLRETRLYLPIQESVIVYDDELDTHEPGTTLTTPKASGFYERNNGAYALSQDDYAIRGKQYYMPVFGNPLMLKVDDILNYTQVYMGEFSAIGVRMDALGLNGNVDLSDRPRVSAETMHEAGYDEFPSGDYATLYSSTYEFEECCLLVTPINQNGTVLSPTEMDDYVDALLEGSVDQIKKNDESHLVIHYVKTNPAGIHQKVLDIDDSCNPSEEGYYEYNSTDKYYFPTEDVSVVSGKSYYTSTLDDLADKAHDLSSDWEEAIDTYFPNGATPASLGYYEVKQYGYVLTADTKPVRNKNYYTLRPEETRSRLEEKYGVIVRSVDFSDVNGINDEAKQLALYKRAVEYIHKTCTDLPEQITLTAIDLRNLDTSIEQMKIGCDIHVKSKPHAIDRHMKCISIDYYLDSPEKNSYVISSKPTGSDAIPRFTEQAETKKKSGSGGAKDSSGGTGGSFGGGGSSPEQTEEEIAVLKNHVFYTAGSEEDATITGSYNQLFAKALGMLVDENGNPLVDIEGNWAWDNVNDASTPRNSIITKLDLRPSSGALISEINTTYEVVLNPTGSPKQQGWYEYKKRVEYRATRDTEVIPDKDYYDLSKHKISDPSTAVYQAVTPAESDKPNEKGWYELNDGNYVATEDTEVVDGKKYYSKKSPKEMNWQEPQTEGNYELTADNSVNDGKRYCVRHEGGSETIASSRVEVHPSQVIINSLNNPTYHQVETPIPAGTNPRKSRWYVLVDGEYRRTDDETVVSSHTYYYVDTIASGSVEVTPGDILIESINQNNDSNAKIKANKITLKGNTTVDGVFKITDDGYMIIYAPQSSSLSAIMQGCLEVDGDWIKGHVFQTMNKNGNVGYLRLVGANGGEYYDISANNAKDMILGFGTPDYTTNPGYVTIPYYTVKNPSTNPLATNVLTFEKATTSVHLDGAWGSGGDAGKYIVVVREDTSIRKVLNPGLRLNGAGGSNDFSAQITETVSGTEVSRKSTPGYIAKDASTSGSSTLVKVYKTRSGSQGSYTYSSPVAQLNVGDVYTSGVSAGRDTIPTGDDDAIGLSKTEATVGSFLPSGTTPDSTVKKENGAFSGFIYLKYPDNRYKCMRSFSLSVPTPTAKCTNTAAYAFSITIDCAGKKRTYILKTDSAGRKVSFG